jgi:transposase
MKVHANAPLGPKGRLTMVLRVLERGWSLAEAAVAAGVSERTCSKWVARYRAEGEAGLLDRSSAPKSIPHRTSEELVEAIVLLRRLRMTGAEIAFCLGLALSTVSAVLLRVGLGKLSRLEPPEPPNRYERQHPGELIHVDVKKLGCTAGRDTASPGSAPARPGPAATGAGSASRDGSSCTSASTTPRAWPTSRSSTTRRAMTAAGFLRRAVTFYAAHGISVERVMSDGCMSSGVGGAVV